MSQTAHPPPDREEFAHATEPFRRELLAHCYRLLGSVDEAQDAVQDTYLRAWRSYAGFEGRSSVRSWLYTIATNVCLTTLRRRSRRALPSGLGAPGDNPLAPPVLAGSEVMWLQPIPDGLVTPESDDPAEITASRDSLRLALIASLQYLPARQRAVFILRDVLRWPASEAAQVLDTTTAAVKSSLQRARARVAEVTSDEQAPLSTPTESERRALLERYIVAFERADPAAIEGVLREDATLEMIPFRTWFAGRKTCAPYIINQVLGSAGDWRMVPTSANGQPAAAAYRRQPDESYQAFGIAVLTPSPRGIARIVVFADSSLVTTFGLEAAIDGGFKE